jgi:hypothetical protein
LRSFETGAGIHLRLAVIDIQPGGGWDGITPVQRQMLDRAAMLTRVIPSTGGTPSLAEVGGVVVSY